MRIYLAPMEGVIDSPMRFLLTQIGGIDLCTSEFIRVTQHTLPSKVFFRYCPEIDPKSKQSSLSRCPIRVQLLGSDPILLALNAQKAAKLGAPGIDLNFGCPAKTVNKNRGGACLLDDTLLIHDIVCAVREAVPDEIPVSVKIRLGYESRDSGLRNANAIEKAGANELVVHARSKADSYKPPAYWNEIFEIQESLSIPVIANGEIWNVNDYLRCKRESGCENVMLGRGLLAQPNLALQIKALEKNKDHSALTWPEVAQHLFEFFLMTRDQYPKKYLGNRVKQWLHYLKIHYAEAHILFESLKKERDENRLYDALKPATLAA